MEALFFVLGAIAASFVGVVVARLYTGQSFLAGRSHCDACGAFLEPPVLIPIVSFVVFGGRARCCGARLALKAPLTEILLGGLFVLAYLRVGFSGELLPLLLALTLLLALVLYDLEHQMVPPALLVSFIVLSAVVGAMTFSSVGTFFPVFYTAFLIASSLALIHFFSRGRAMGFSDAPLAFGLALLTGTAALSGFIFSFWIGAVVGIVILLRRPAGSRMGIEVPFAPFLAAGFLLAYFTQWNPFALIAALLLY